MTDEQPLALVLAEKLARRQILNIGQGDVCEQFATELRRLHKWEEIFSEWDGPEDVHEMLCDQAKDINHLKADNAKLRDLHKGMSIRDYFAAKAMQALSNGEWPDARDSLLIAERAYAMADAMIKARSQS